MWLTAASLKNPCFLKFNPGTHVKRQVAFDSVWIIKVIEVDRVDLQKESEDSYQHKIAPGVLHLSGHFLEKDTTASTMKLSVYKLSQKTTYFFSESIIFPYVNIYEGKRGLTLSMGDYADITLKTVPIRICKLPYIHQTTFIATIITTLWLLTQGGVMYIW